MPAAPPRSNPAAAPNPRTRRRFAGVAAPRPVAPALCAPHRGGGVAHAACRELTAVVTKRPYGPLSDHTRQVRGARLASSLGQASVELVVLLPVILVVLAVGFQAVLAGQAIWEARVAARAAARANSLGADAAAAARAHLPAGLEHGLRVDARAGGDVQVSVRVPTLIPSIRLGRVSATSHFRPQSG
jgi:hypothetical protein